MKNLAIIPARGGSKRLPGKNTKTIGGKTLVQRASEAAVESKCFTDIMLTTDSNEIIGQCKEYENLEIHKRSKALSGDKTTVLQVVLNIIESLEKKNNTYDTITILLPTVPFRKAGSLVIFDTDGFHKEGLLTEGERKVIRGHSHSKPLVQYKSRMFESSMLTLM